eukprot:363411-Chlamydomonas_euryale.AAC.12
MTAWMVSQRSTRLHAVAPSGEEDISEVAPGTPGRRPMPRGFCLARRAGRWPADAKRGFALRKEPAGGRPMPRGLYLA